MIWHILKKDIRLLWRMVLVVVALEILRAVVVVSMGLPVDNNSKVLATFCMLASTGAKLLLILLLVRQDSPIGTGQDWLIRPISRWSMMLAKIAFVLLVVHLPSSLLSFVIAFEHGYPLDVVVSTALSTELLSFMQFSLPVMVIGSVTSSLTGAILLGLGLGVALPIFRFGVVPFLAPSYLAVALSGFAWTREAVTAVVLCLGAPVVLWFAYARREFFYARLALAAGYALLTLIAFMPFGAAFAIQSAFAKDPSLGNGIQVEYDGKSYQRLSGRSRYATYRSFPLRISGLPANSVLMVNRAHLRLLDEGGRTLYEADARESLFKDTRKISAPSYVLASSDRIHDGVLNGRDIMQVPPAIYAQLKGTSLRLSVDYDITVLQRGPVDRVPVLFDRQRVEGVGICESATDPRNDQLVSVRCFPAPEHSDCMKMVAIDRKTGTQNRQQKFCHFSGSAPKWFSGGERLGLGSLAWYYTFPAGNETSLQTPLSVTDIDHADFIIEVYQPKAYIHRHYETPLLSLDDL